MKRKRQYSLFLVLLLSALFIYKIAYSLDYPHSDANAISCRSCHAAHVPLPQEWAKHPPVNADDTPLNNLCWSCHNDTIALYEKTHSSLSTSSSYGDWTFECRVCHNPHKQSQTEAYGVDTYLYSGQSTSVTADAVTKTSRITKTGAGWTADQNEWAEMLVIPDISATSPVYYKIISNTSESLTVEGVIDLVAVHDGDTFAIVYGKSVKESVNSRPVKFFNQSGTNSFADGNTTYDGICEVCHTQTRHFRRDGTSEPHSDGQSKAGVRCTDCHSHREGFKGSCNSCHGNPPVDEATLAHTAPTGSTTAGAHDLHVSGKGFSCSVCHLNSVGTGTTHNDHKITIGFFLFGGSYLGGRYDGQTSAQYESSETGTTVANTGTKECSNIYCHGSTMAPNGGTDTTPVWDDPSTAGCGTCHGATAANPPVRGSHQKHAGATGRSLECTACHYGYETLHVNNEANFAFDTATYPWLSGAAYSGDTTMLNAYGNCSNLYCHSNVQSSNGTTGPTVYASPTWGNAATGACGTCHEADTGAKMSTGSHTKHTADSPAGSNISCGTCHFGAGSGTQKHADRNIDVVFNAVNSAGTYSQAGVNPPGNGYGTCTNLYCHSNANPAPNAEPSKNEQNEYKTPAWGQGSLACDSCHRGRTTDTLTMRSNGHDRLVGKDWIRKYPCEYCHAATVDSAGNIKDTSKHADGTKDVVMSERWAIVGRDLPSYDPASKICSNVYCHSDGTTNPEQVRPFSWTASGTHCNTCHGHPMGSCGNCHADGRTGWPAGEEWKEAMPMFPNQGAGTARANSHPRHLQTNFPCDKCHYATIKNGTCTDCHVNGLPAGSMSEAAHIDPAYHVNKEKDVVFKDGGTYNKITKTCSNTACHSGGQDPQWGGSVNTTIICLNCHGTTEPDVDDFDAFNGTQAKINLTEWATTGHGRPTSAGPYPVSGNPAANFPGNPCWYCHDNNVLHKDPSNPFRLRQHKQFGNRFEKECVYCHMQGIDSECLGCHNSAESLAPQLASITNPPFTQDHTLYADGQTACVTTCHTTDETRHHTGAGIWTAEQKADIKNQYMMMGVCLKCHDDDSDGKCSTCHTGEKYKLGFDPGTGFITAVKSKATSVHFGYKHYAEYVGNGVWKGGKFCWDCHDPHGDTNIYMIHKNIATSTDGKFGKPLTRAEVVFTNNIDGTYYARYTSPPYNGICNVCHSNSGQHYRANGGDGHNISRKCTNCHEHRFTDSHASDQACSTCHQNKPVPRHSGFSLPRDCTKCHAGTIGMRMDVMGQLKSNSHHIQGVEVNNKHCYACHWEATAEGLIDVDYHSGYNYKTHTSVKNAEVDLVIWGPGSRPTTYQENVTAVKFLASNMGTANERSEVSKVSMVCLSCHSDQNNDTEPFGDCKTPRRYAWDKKSIAARYSQTGTTTWGKYAATPNAAPKNLIKAYSAHGNAVSNQGGWSAATGYDGPIADTRNGSANVQCFDCHSSHGSKVTGTTSSYVTFNGTNNGGNLKETQAGKGGYAMTYKASSNTSGINPYGAGAGQCFDCHESANKGITPWGYNSTFGATAPIMGYKDTPRFGQGTKGSTARYAYRNIKKTIIGGHLKASSPLTNQAMGTINGLCTPCHDPHGVSPALASDQQYAVPLLKGAWLTSPYKEDAPAPMPYACSGSGWQWGNPNNYCDPWIWGVTNYNLDSTTFGGITRIAEDDRKFGGLCLGCHSKTNLTDGISKNQNFRTIDRVHEAVKGWGANTQHSYPCAKCHQAHNSGLPRLMQTNCLDSNHRAFNASGGVASSGYYGSYPSGSNGGSCHSTAPLNPGGSNLWNTVTPW